MQVVVIILHKYSFFAVFLFRLCAWCPLYTQIKRFKRVLLFGWVVIPHSRLKSICVRTHRANLAHLPAEYIPPTFWLVHPSPFCAGWRWGLLSRKIFFDFQNIVSTRQVFTRYSLLAFIFSRFILVWFWFRIYFISFTIFDSDYNLGFCVFRFWIFLASISTCFSIVDFTFWLLCLS